MKITVTAVTHPEHAGGVNQDAVIARRTKTADGKDVFFTVVCDGMGDKGHVASASVAAAFNAWFDAFVGTERADDSSEAVYKCWDAILTKMTKRLYAGLFDGGSCATVAVLMLMDGKWYAENIGDVRIYQISDEGVTQVSTDHTFAEREISLGRMDPMEAMSDPQAFFVLQAVGSTKDIIPSKKTGTASPGTVFLVCTDGFYRKNRKSTLYKQFRPDLMEEGKEAEVLNKVEGNALGSGETDDMSAVLIRILPEFDEGGEL